LMQPREKIDELQKMCILSNSTKFSAVQPLLLAYNFSATMASTYSTHRLGAVASLNFFAIENMPPHFSAISIVDKWLAWCGSTPRPR